MFANRSLAELLGLSAEKVASLGDQLMPTVIHPDDLESVHDHHARMLAARTGEVVEHEYRVRDGNGDWHWLHSWEVILRRDAQGVPQQLIGIAQDVSDRVKFEQDLGESRQKHAEAEQRFRSIAENPYGSTFEVWLPLASGKLAAPKRDQVSRPRGTETVLVVEDEEHVLRSTTQMLQRLGYQVITATRAEEAVDLVRTGTRFDLLLTDVLLPGMTGHDLFRELTASLGHVAVVFMSGYTDNVLADKGLADAGAAFLAKPFSWDELALSVRAAIDTQVSALA